MSLVKIIDPPSGWMYGFPKPYFPKAGQTLEQWFLQEGYPQKEIAQGMLLRCWFWYVEMSDEEIQKEQMRQWNI